MMNLRGPCFQEVLAGGSFEVACVSEAGGTSREACVACFRDVAPSPVLVAEPLNLDLKI